MEVTVANNTVVYPYVLNSYKDLTRDMCYNKGWHKSNIEQVWLLLTEEIGELAGSIRRATNQFYDGKLTKIEDELGDVFSYLFQLAYMLNVDLDAMWHKNQIKAYSKQYFHQNHQHHRNHTADSRTLTSST